MLAFPSTPLFASDFGPMVNDLLIMVGVIVALAVALALLTWAALRRKLRHKGVWMGFFAVLWFLAILYGIGRWHEHEYESSREPPPSTPSLPALEDPVPANPGAAAAP